MPRPQRRTFFPKIEPYRRAMLTVSGGHELYIEESGNPKGKPVIVLHGGPGAASGPLHRRFFDPKMYRVVLMDQRGCGRSTPFMSLRQNTTWHLVADIDELRAQLGIERWQVFGGSWGSTLALAYAQTHPSRVTELILRGTFLLRRADIDWFYQEGASHLFPDAWEAYLAPIPARERSNMVKAYARRLQSPNRSVQKLAARAWSRWEARTSNLRPGPNASKGFGSGRFAMSIAQMECHYFVHGGWLDGKRALIRNVDAIRGIPTVMVHGRYDLVCPLDGAWVLHRAWPEAKLIIVEGAGHSSTEPGILHELILATERFKTRKTRKRPGP